MEHRYQQSDHSGRGSFYGTPSNDHDPMPNSVNMTSDSKTILSLMTQVAHLTEQMTSHQDAADKKFETFFKGTNLQMQLMTERLNNLESKYNQVSSSLKSILQVSETDPSAVSGNMKSKLDMISKQMADLSQDITKLSDKSSAESSSGPVQAPKQSQPDAVASIMGVTEIHDPTTVESTSSLHSMPNITTSGSTQAIDSPASIRGNPGLLSKPGVMATSPLAVGNLQPTPIHIHDGTPGDHTLMDIKWNKTLGVPSPSIPSPFNPNRLTLDYPYSMTRNASFSKQLMPEFDRKPSAVPEKGPPVDTPLTAEYSNPTSAESGIGQYELDPLSEFSGLIGPQRKKRKSSKSSDSSDNTSPTSIIKHETPQYKLQKNARLVADIWKEWEYGVNGNPPLKVLEAKYSARWRNETESRTFIRRKKIYQAVETGKARGYEENDIIEELENSRNYLSNGTIKRKPLTWLYNNIPKKYQTE